MQMYKPYDNLQRDEEPESKGGITKSVCIPGNKSKYSSGNIIPA